MPRPRQDAHPWTLKILELIEDGEWHECSTLVPQVMVMVPPGMAWRKAEYFRGHHYTMRGEEPKERTRGGRDDTIKTGQKQYVMTAIRGLRRDGRIEVEYENPESKRLRPSRIRLVLDRGRVKRVSSETAD